MKAPVISMVEFDSGLLDVLRARLGAKHVIVDPADMAGYLVEERKLYRGTAMAVDPPGQHGGGRLRRPGMREGGRRHRAAGRQYRPRRRRRAARGIVLSLARLDRIREVNAFNATITAEAGCILKSVQDAARAVDCIFPLSLASEGSCRIGGNIATNAGGVNVLRYGNTRDLVLGLEVVLADGRIWNGLKGLRKDNMGYDLKNLFIGSEGTLGIITAAVLKLFPRPKTQVVAFVGCASPHAALDLFESLRQRAGDELTAFEFMPRFALEIVLKHAPGAIRPLEGDHAAYALIELSSPDPELDLREQMEKVLEAAFEAGTVEDATIAASEAQNAALWHLRESLSDVQGLEGGSIKHDVSVPVSDVADFIVDGKPGLRGGVAERARLRLRPFRRRQHPFQPEPARGHGEAGLPRAMGALQPDRPRHRPCHERLDRRRARGRPHQARRAGALQGSGRPRPDENREGGARSSEHPQPRQDRDAGRGPAAGPAGRGQDVTRPFRFAGG